MKVRIVSFLLFLVTMPIFPLSAKNLGDNKQNAPVLFFYSKNCAQCCQMKQVIDQILLSNEEIVIELHDIDEEPQIWATTCESRGIPVWGVPRIFIGEQIFAGWFEYKGDLRYADSYHGYIGYRNQIVLALEAYFDTSISGIETETSAQMLYIQKDEDCGC